MKPPYPTIIFAGTPEFAAVHLSALLQAGIPIKAVYTQPDRRAGRGKKLKCSEVKLVAQDHDIEVYQPESFKREDHQLQLAQLKPDLMIVVAYGSLLPPAVLQIPRLGCVNMHGSSLPRWRGAAPIQRAIAAGDKTTGVCLMQLEEGLDTGPVFAHQPLDILETDSSAELELRMSQLSAKLLVDNVPKLLREELTATPQDHTKATYAHKLLKEEALLDWSKSATELSLLIKAFVPKPICFFRLNEHPIKVWKAEAVDTKNALCEKPGTVHCVDNDCIEVNTGEGRLTLIELQNPGKRPMLVSELLRGNPNRFQAGMQL